MIDVRNRFDDSGQMAGIEAVPFGFLILVVGSLLLANAWAVVDAKFAVTAAAREGTRAYVEAWSAVDAEQAALHAARQSIAGHGRDPANLSLQLDPGAGFERCSRVTIEASLAVPSVNLPFIGGFGRTFQVRATHSEIVDPYRSGLSGEAACGA
jgi:hypothetical protein